jgi:hypothetical protein
MTRSISSCRPITGSISLAGGLFLLPGEIRVQLLQNLRARLLDVNVQGLQHPRGHSVPLAQQAQQNVLGADIGVVQVFGFFGGKGQHLLHPRGVGDVPDHLLVRSRTHLLLDLEPHGFQIEPEFLQDIDGDSLAQFDQPEQQMLGPDKIVVEPVGLLPRQRKHLLRARREVIRGFFAHNVNLIPILMFVQRGAFIRAGGGRGGPHP